VPTVTLTGPANRTIYKVPATIVMTATAADSDGTIGRVDFFAGTVLVGTATASPYSVTWNNAPLGSYTLTARATDNEGASAVSGAVTIQIKKK
jgi:hypothetical protein